MQYYLKVHQQFQILLYGIKIDYINSAKIKGWNLLSRSEIHNNLILDITTPTNLTYDNYYELYSLNHNNATPNMLPSNSIHDIKWGLPLNILFSWGTSKIGNVIVPGNFPNGVSSGPNVLLTVQQNGQNYLITNVTGTLTAL